MKVLLDLNVKGVSLMQMPRMWHDFVLKASTKNIHWFINY